MLSECVKTSTVALAIVRGLKILRELDGLRGRKQFAIAEGSNIAYPKVESEIQRFIMRKSEWVLAAMASTPKRFYSPVQLQKLMFMIDRNLLASNPNFNFVAYDYGPFDADVYRELERLQAAEYVAIDGDGKRRRYRLTSEGSERGEELLQGMQPGESKYLRELSNWITSLSFAELVTAIYRQYPEMKANSVFSH